MTVRVTVITARTASIIRGEIKGIVARVSGIITAAAAPYKLEKTKYSTDYTGCKHVRGFELYEMLDHVENQLAALLAVVEVVQVKGPTVSVNMCVADCPEQGTPPGLDGRAKTLN